MREHNEDGFGVAAERGLFVVADGCGGVSSGERASEIAVQTILNAPITAPRDPIACAIEQASRAILQSTRDNPEARGMGATVAALLLGDGRATLAHVGDCRVGRLVRSTVFHQDREDEIRVSVEWLTQDHLLWRELLRSGASDDAVAQVREQHGTVITRAAGVRDDVDVDVRYHTIGDDPLFILSTDGLHAQVDDARIADVLSHGERSLQARCRELLEASDEAGGYDNATVILVEPR